MQSTEHSPQQATAPGELNPAPMPPELLRVAQGIIAAVLIIAPLIFMPPDGLLFNSLDTPRRLVLLLGASLLAGLIVLSWARRRRLALRWHLLDLPVILLLLAGIISGIGAISKTGDQWIFDYFRVTFFGPVWCEDGLLFLGTGIFLYLGIKEFIRTKEDIERTAFLVVLVGCVVAVLGLCDYKFNWNFNYHFSGKRLIGTLGNSMFTGTYLAMLIPLALGVMLATHSTARRVIMFVSYVILLPALALTMARAAWIGLAVALLFTLIVLAVVFARQTAAKKVFDSARFAWLAAAVFITFAMAGSALLLPSVRSRIASIGSDKSTMQTRLIYMQTSLKMFLARPISGWGVGNLRMIYPQHRPYSLVHEQNLPLNRGYNTSFPHNILLHVAAEMGALGLLSYLLLIGVAFYSGFRALKDSPWLATGLLGLVGTYLLTNMLAFDNSATMSTFWIGLALLATLTAKDRVLPARYGALSAPLAGRVPELLSILSLVIFIGMSYNVIAQTWVSYISERGVLKAQKMFLYMQSDPKTALQYIDSAIQDVELGLGMRVDVKENGTLWVPLWSRIFSPIPDYQQAQTLALTYRSKMTLLYNATMLFEARNDQRATFYWFMQARQSRLCYLGAGQLTLGLMERAPIVSRFLIMEYARASEFERSEGIAAQLEEGKRLAKKLVAFEPNSAEVCLMAAEVRGNSNEFEEAMKQALNAVRLDPSFADAYAMLGHYQFQLVTIKDPRSHQLIYECIDNFSEALRRGSPLRPDHRMEYANALFFVGSESPGFGGRTAAAIEQGRMLWGTPVFNALLDTVRSLYKLRKEPERGEQIIQRLKAGMPQPKPAPKPKPAPAPKPANQHAGASAATGSTPWSP